MRRDASLWFGSEAQHIAVAKGAAAPRMPSGPRFKKNDYCVSGATAGDARLHSRGAKGALRRCESIPTELQIVYELGLPR